MSKRLPATRIDIEKVDYAYFSGNSWKSEWDMWLYIDRFPPQCVTTYKRKRDAVRGASRLSTKLVKPIPYDHEKLDIYLEGKRIA